MKKLFLIPLVLLMAIGSLCAQSDEDLFGSDDDLFGDDDFLIEEVEDVSAKSDLSKGLLFDNGSVKIGGNFSTSIGTSVIAYADDGKSFLDHFSDTKIKPDVGAYITVDARPKQDLRMYSKFGFRYPFASKAFSKANTSGNEITLPGGQKKTLYTTDVETTVQDWIYLKEIFTDFSVADRAFFRFGLHTVTWGTGLFFSPVSDIVNTTMIDPENTDAQVNGCFNLRTQITFPDTQNCLWLYVLPAFDYAKNCAFAGKYDLVLGGWELGLGGYWKYKTAPKVTLTASGSIKKLSLFGEGVFQYGSVREWDEDKDKSPIFKATAGFRYTWSDPAITLLGQYYYDGSNFKFDEKSMDDLAYLMKNPMYIMDNVTKGHNAALALSFGRLFGTTKLSAAIFGMVNFGKEKLPSAYAQMLKDNFEGADSLLNYGTFSATLNYSPVDTISMGIGPYVTFIDWDSKPEVSVKLNFSLGGGKF